MTSPPTDPHADDGGSAPHDDPSGHGPERAAPASLLRILGIGLAIALLVPPGVFLLVALLSGMGVGGGGAAMIEQYGTDRLNLGVLGLTGVIPFALLVVVLAIVKRFAGPMHIRGIATGSTAIIALLLVWAHWTFWPDFLPERVYPGWPHGIEFVIVPLFFAPIGAVFGGLAGFFVSRGNRA